MTRTTTTGRPTAGARCGSGLTAGVLLTVLATLLVAMAAQQAGPDTGEPALSALAGVTAAWVWRNLGWSLPVFAAVLALYVHSLDRLRSALRQAAPPDEVSQADHLTDVWTSLFFGVGVIWTAIGMRGALVQALGAPAGSGAGVEVLQRMVDGGILLALSTTIFGGIGGYCMRAWKAVVVGGDLKRYYDADARRDLTALRVSVSAIERRLAGAGQTPRPDTAPRQDATPRPDTAPPRYPAPSPAARTTAEAGSPPARAAETTR